MEDDSVVKDSIGIQECEFRNYDEESVTKPNRNPSLQTTKDILAFNNGKDSDACCICLQIFDDKTWFIRWGHIFHIAWITVNPSKSIKLKRCPLCKDRIPCLTKPTKLIMNPETLGSKKLENLLWTNKLLKRRNEKLILKQKELKKDSRIKDSEIYILKTLMNQFEANEEEILNQKEANQEVIESLLKGEPKAWWKSKECIHNLRFQKTISNLQRNSGSKTKYQEATHAANNKFMADVIRNGFKIMKNHRFNTSLPFFILRARKLNNFVDRNDINRRAGFLTYKGDVFEVYKDFGSCYDQFKVEQFNEIVKEYKMKLIANNGKEFLDESVASIEDKIGPIKYAYDTDKRIVLLKKAYKQISEASDGVKSKIFKTEEALYSKSKEWNNSKTHLTLLQKQSELLKRVINLLNSKIKDLDLHQNKQHGEGYQEDHDEERKEGRS